MADETRSSGLGSGDVTELLSDKALRALRRYYDDKTMSATATSVLVKEFPESKAYVTAVHDSLFGGKTAGSDRTLSGLTDRERETALIVLLASQRASLELAIHVYWALMEGLTSDEIAGLLMVAGIYGGIGTQTAGLKVMRTTLTQLEHRYQQAAEMTADERKEHLATVPVLYAILDAFA